MARILLYIPARVVSLYAAPTVHVGTRGLCPTTIKPILKGEIP